MSYDYRQSTQRRSTNTYNRPGRRSLYAPPPPPPRGSSSSHHGLFTYWIPLLVTGTIAIGGLAAWVWSEREHSHHEDDEYHSDGKPPRPSGPPQGGGGMGQPNMPQGPYQPSAPAGLQGPSGPVVAPPSSTGGGPPTVPPSVSAPGGEAASYYDQSQSYRGGAQTGQQTSESRDVDSAQQQGGGGWYDRVTGIFQRTPLPQQIMSSAGKLGTAAMAGLGSILEDGGEDDVQAYDERRTEQQGSTRSTRRRRSDETLELDRRQKEQDRLTREREGFSDHERWSEEAEEQGNRISVVEKESERRAESAREQTKGKARKGRSVAVVVNADVPDASGGGVHDDGEEEGVGLGDASILSHLPTSSSQSSDLFILIHAPGLQGLPPTSWRPQGPSSPASTGAAVNTPGSELQSMSPRPSSPTNFNPTPQFSALYSQALTLVSNPSQILPFTTLDGYVHILRHLAPQLVYISDSLAGREGEDVARLKGWVGHTVLVAGDEGLGGLVDTETETEAEDDKGKKRNKKKGREGKWYERSEFVGLGKDVEVVDAGRVGEDWTRRVGGRE